MTESELIDKILDSLRAGYDMGILDKETFLIYPATIKKMRAYGLVQVNGMGDILLEKGYQVLDAGGFDNWKATNEKRTSELHQAALHSAKSTSNALYPNWIAALATVAALGFGVYQTMGKNEAEKELTALRSELRTLKDSLTIIQSQSRRTNAGLPQTKKMK